MIRSNIDIDTHRSVELCAMLTRWFECLNTHTIVQNVSEVGYDRIPIRSRSFEKIIFSLSGKNRKLTLDRFNKMNRAWWQHSWYVIPMWMVLSTMYQKLGPIGSRFDLEVSIFSFSRFRLNRDIIDCIDLIYFNTRRNGPKFQHWLHSGVLPPLAIEFGPSHHFSNFRPIDLLIVPKSENRNQNCSDERNSNSQ